MIVEIKGEGSMRDLIKFICEMNLKILLTIPPPLKLYPFSIWFPEVVRNQIKLVPS